MCPYSSKINNALIMECYSYSIQTFWYRPVGWDFSKYLKLGKYSLYKKKKKKLFKVVQTINKSNFI